jgi:IMP cyclohydrolase
MAFEITGSFRENMKQNLAENPYPGRGIVIGRIGDMAIQLYWLMGRDEKTSRNRVLVGEGNLVRSERFDKAKPLTREQKELIEYDAMRTFAWEMRSTKTNEVLETNARTTTHVVTNGNQTDTIMQGLRVDWSPEASLATRTYEPDQYDTPRISAVIETQKDKPAEFMISVIRRGSYGETVHQFHRGVLAEVIHRGAGLCVNTYLDDDGPVAFNKDPYGVMLGKDLEKTAKEYWELLNPDNRVALVAKSIILATGEVDYHIINRHEIAA